MGLWCFFSSIHYMVYWLRLHPGVRHSGLLCHSPPEHAGEIVEDYVHSYNKACPMDRQHNREDQDQTDPELWNDPMEGQGESEEDLEPSPLRAPQKYHIIRLSWLKWSFHLKFDLEMVLLSLYSILKKSVSDEKIHFRCCFMFYQFCLCIQNIKMIIFLFWLIIIMIRTMICMGQIPVTKKQNLLHNNVQSPQMHFKLGNLSNVQPRRLRWITNGR